MFVKVNNSMDNARAVCPVCSMMVSRETAFASKFRGRKYYFCCNDCKSAFTMNPFKFTLV